MPSHGAYGAQLRARGAHAGCRARRRHRVRRRRLGHRGENAGATGRRHPVRVLAGRPFARVPGQDGEEFYVLRLDSNAVRRRFRTCRPSTRGSHPTVDRWRSAGNRRRHRLRSRVGAEHHAGGHGGGALSRYVSDHLLVTAGQGGIMGWNMAPQGVAELGNLRTEGTLWFDSQPGAGDTITALLVNGPEEVTAASIDLSTGASRPVARFWSANFAGAVASPDGALVAGTSLDDGVPFVVDVASGDTIATLRPCELVKTVDAVRLLAFVVRYICQDESQEAVADQARSGIVDLRTGELVGAIETPRFVAYAALGRPGTIAEDLLVFQTFPAGADTRQRGGVPPGIDRRVAHLHGVQLRHHHWTDGQRVTGWHAGHAGGADGPGGHLRRRGDPRRCVRQGGHDRLGGPDQRPQPPDDAPGRHVRHVRRRDRDPAMGHRVRAGSSPRLPPTRTAPQPSSPSRTGPPSSTPTPTV